MRLFKTITLLTLGLLIFGSAGYFGYILFIRPVRAEWKEKAAAAAAPAATPTPDPAVPEFERLAKLQASGNTPAVREGWTAWVAAHPKSPLLADGRRRLGSANMALLFDPSNNTSMITYTVVKGDSLAKIASKQHSNAELIQKASGLPNINLQIGQQLVIPQLKLSLELDRAAKTLTLLNNGSYLKEYLLLSSPSAPASPSNIATKVLDKSAVAGAKRVAFGDKTYVASEKSILLTQSPAIVAAPEQPAASAPQGDPPAVPAAAPSPVAMPGGYVLSTSDLQEIFPLVSRNTPVIIH